MRHVATSFLAFSLLGAAAGCASLGLGGNRSEGPPPSLIELDQGVYRVPEVNADALLSLQDRQDVRVLVIGNLDRDRISNAHIGGLREWIENGGVLWVEGRAADERLLNPILPVQVDRFRFRKTASGDTGGELIVRGTSEKIDLAEHELTDGVDRLYLYPRYRFNGTPQAQPIVTMTDAGGETGIVLAAVPLGSGTVVLDGTARESRLLFGRIPGFDPAHPNARREGDTWVSYDWPRLVRNAREMAGRDETIGTGSP